MINGVGAGKNLNAKVHAHCRSYEVYHSYHVSVDMWWMSL